MFHTPTRTYISLNPFEQRSFLQFALIKDTFACSLSLSINKIPVYVRVVRGT